MSSGLEYPPMGCFFQDCSFQNKDLFFLPTANDAAPLEEQPSPLSQKKPLSSSITGSFDNQTTTTTELFQKFASTIQCKRKGSPSLHDDSVSDDDSVNEPCAPLSERDKFFCPNWVRNSILRLDEEFQKNSESICFSCFCKTLAHYLNNDLTIQDPIITTHRPFFARQIRSIIESSRRSSLAREQEEWSQIEEAFLLSISSEAQDKDTLYEVALALQRSPQSCENKWQKLIQQAASSTTDMQNTTPPLTALENDPIWWKKWPKTMIALWMAKLQKIYSTWTPDDCYRYIADLLKLKGCSEKFQQNLYSLIANAKKGKISLDRSQEPWTWFEIQLLRDTLFNHHKNPSLNQDAGNLLGHVLCLLERVPAGTVLTREDLAKLQVPLPEELKRLKGSFNQGSVSAHPIKQKPKPGDFRSKRGRYENPHNDSPNRTPDAGSSVSETWPEEEFPSFTNVTSAKTRLESPPFHTGEEFSPLAQRIDRFFRNERNWEELEEAFGVFPSPSTVDTNRLLEIERMLESQNSDPGCQ